MKDLLEKNEQAPNRTELTEPETVSAGSGFDWEFPPDSDLKAYEFHLY